jgi:RNA polymerase sigma-70 factor, ECF subfamily
MSAVVQPEAMTRAVAQARGRSEPRTFETFFRDEYVRLGRALYLVTGDPGEAEDLAQEAMLRVFERWDRVSEMDSPTGYLYRAALNLRRSRLRRVRAWRSRGTVSSGPTDPIRSAEDRDEISRLLSELPPGQCEALVLVEWIGMTSMEAGRVLGIDPVSVRVRVSRAKAALRTTHEHEQVEDGP